MRTKTYATIAEDVVINPSDGCQLLRVGGAGRLDLDYGSGITDSIECDGGERLYLSPHKILGTSTCTNVTLFFYENRVRVG